MRVLITGAGGFSGSQLTMAMVARGHQVTAVVGSGRGRLPPDAEHRGTLTVVVGDLSEDTSLPVRSDAIVHAAARSPGTGVSADDFIRDNVLATRRVVQHAKGSAAKRIVFLSSLSIY